MDTDGISGEIRGILHFRNVVYASKLMLAVFAEVSLDTFVFAVFDYIF